MHRAAFIPGDGIGPEVAWAARRCVDATGVGVTWVDCAVGGNRLAVAGAVLPPGTAEALLAAGLVLKGPLDGSGPAYEGNPNTALEELFDVFATVRHCRSFRPGGGAGSGFDLLVIADKPAGGILEVDPASPEWRSLQPRPGGVASAATIRLVQPDRVREFFEFALAHAAARSRRKITFVHRANVHKKADGAWLRIGEEVARRHTELACEDQLVDHVAMQLARTPDRFDVLVVSPLYGEVLGDLAVGLAGGVEFVPEILAGRRGSLFTTVHGTAPRFAGLGRANPCAMILSAASMLRAVGEPGAARAVEAGVEGALALGPGDPGDFADAVIEHVRLGAIQSTPAAAGGAS